MIYEEIKFRLDHNYYKKTEFIEKYKDSITDIILQIPIAEDGRKYMYFIIDYANIKHRVEERLLQKIPQEIGKPKDFDALVKKEIDSDVEKFKNNNISPYREENKIELIPLVIVVQQGKDFFIDSNLQKTVITVPCKLGSIKKDAFSLRTDHDIEFQYNARMNFHKKNDTSRNMDMEGPITSSEAMMKKFTDNYNDYKSRIVKIQSKLGKLKSQKQQSDSSDQNKVTSSNPQQSIPGPDKSIEQLRNKRLKKIRANPNDDLMCIIIFCFLADYNHVNGVSDIDLCIRTMSHDGFTDYKRGSRDSGDFLKNYR